MNIYFATVSADEYLLYNGNCGWIRTLRTMRWGVAPITLPNKSATPPATPPANAKTNKCKTRIERRQKNIK